MKLIILTFKTPLGDEAYKKVQEEGKKQSRMDRAIAKRVCKEVVIGNNPTVLEMRVKVPRLAVACELDKQVKTGLAKFGAVADKDYSMEVRY